MNKQFEIDLESKGKHLLVIDDEENMRHMLSNLLKRLGYLVDTASDGFEGLEAVKKSDMHLSFVTYGCRKWEEWTF